MVNVLRGDGVGIEIADGVVRAIRLRHDVRGRVAATAELPFANYDDGAALDSLVLLRAELGQPNEPTRLATFPSPSTLQRLDVTGRKGPELNELRSRLDRLYGINSTIVVDSGPRRFLVLIKWDAPAVRRLEDLAARAGFVDVAVEPSPLAVARVVRPDVTFVRRFASRRDAHQAVVRDGYPVAGSSIPAVGRTTPDVDVSDVEVPMAWFDDFLDEPGLADALDRVSGGADARTTLPGRRDDGGFSIGETLHLSLAGEGYPLFPAHDVRSPIRQCVALGAAAGAAGLAGPVRSVDMTVSGLDTSRLPDRPWAIERLSDLPDVVDPTPVGGLRRLGRRRRRR